MNSPKLIIIGCGFAGLTLAKKLNGSAYDITIIDKNNYYQFQPLMYQVATAGLDASNISFPIRKFFHKSKNIRIRIAEVNKIAADKNKIHTSIGDFEYDYLVIATGAGNNFFGNSNIEKYSYPMKSIEEALYLKNKILQNFEDALTTDASQKEAYMNIVIVGGGPTGVEVSGALAEMKKYVLPKDYPELDFSKMNIILVEGSNKTLAAMSEKSSQMSEKFLGKLGVKVIKQSVVQDYDGENVLLKDGTKINTKTLIWAAGIKGNVIEGIKPELIVKGNRFKVDRCNHIESYENLFAIGDISWMVTEKYPNGHPQVATVANSQAAWLAQNLKRVIDKKPLAVFEYHDKGSMATVGRNLAVVDLPFISFTGFFAWLTWMFLHLMLILGTKNKLFTFFNWAWNYVTFDQSLRLILKPLFREKK